MYRREVSGFVRTLAGYRPKAIRISELSFEYKNKYV